MIASSAAVKHFVYSGQTKSEIPKDITHLTIDSSVTEIPDQTFRLFKQLQEVICQEGLLIIGEEAFGHCYNLEHFNIPTTVKHIRRLAFLHCKKLKLKNTLHEGLETIEGEGGAFEGCDSFRNFRIPSTVQRIDAQAFSFCDRLLSLEAPETIQAILLQAFFCCHRLRNFAIPSSSTEIGSEVFHYCEDLQKIFPEDPKGLIAALRSRFDGLPIHKHCYYHSYQSVERTITSLMEAIESGGPFPLQDCLGMTSLHILVLSTKQNFELCRPLVEKFPECLITTDKWGELPIYYACMVGAPVEFVKFLLESHKAYFPEFDFIRVIMIVHEEMGYTTLENARLVLEFQKTHFPKQKVDFQALLEGKSKEDTTLEILQLLVEYQLEAFSDQALDWMKVIQTILDASNKLDSAARFDMIRYLLDTQKTHCPNQKNRLPGASS